MTMTTIRRVTLVAAALLLAAAPAIADDASLELRKKLARFMEQAAGEGFTGAVIVARGDEVLLRQGYGRIDPDEDRPVRPDTVFTTGSITKQFTAAAILKLEEQGKLSVSDPMSKYLPDVPPDKRAITIHHLMTHQAGFPGGIGDDRERVGRDEYVRRALATKLEFEPGTRYEYSNVGFSLAAAILERVSGQSYEAFLREQLFLPAKMKDTGYSLPGWKADRLAHGIADDGGDWGTVVEHAISDGGPGWHLLGNGGIHSTVDDMLRWHRALQGDAILSAASKRKLYGRHADEGGGTWYGYGWSIEPTEWGELVAHNGGNPYYFADYLRFPEREVVIYYTTTSRERRMNRLARKLARIVFTGEEPALDPPREPVMAGGQAPAAPEGSAAAKWGFPGSHRGMRAAELLDAIVHGDEAARRAFFDTAMAPDVVERNGVDKLLRVFDSLREEMGEYTIRGVRPAGTHRVAIVIDSSTHGAPMELVLDLEPEEPHRILSIAVEVGG